MATFRFTAGPWNVHEGNETFGPGHRKSIPLEEKMKKYAEIGLAGMQFHDDDAVPDMNNMTALQRACRGGVIKWAAARDAAAFLVSVKARNLLICPYLRLTAETKIVVPDGTALGFKPPA